MHGCKHNYNVLVRPAASRHASALAVMFASMTPLWAFVAKRAHSSGTFVAQCRISPPKLKGLVTKLWHG
jgi:hypothetical protein